MISISKYFVFKELLYVKRTYHWFLPKSPSYNLPYGPTPWAVTALTWTENCCPTWKLVYVAIRLLVLWTIVTPPYVSLTSYDVTMPFRLPQCGCCQRTINLLMLMLVFTRFTLGPSVGAVKQKNQVQRLKQFILRMYFIITL